MIDINTVVLENGIEYAEVDDLIYENTKYILLSNIDNVRDSCIRKITVDNNLEYISELDDDKEFDIILKLFLEKNKALFSYGFILFFSSYKVFIAWIGVSSKTFRFFIYSSISFFSLLKLRGSVV